jgi:hypothetical protein
LRFALTTSPGFSVRGWRPGDPSRRARARLRKVAQRGSVALLVASSRGRLLLLGADRKQIRFIALLPQRATNNATRAWLDESR